MAFCNRAPDMDRYAILYFISKCTVYHVTFLIAVNGPLTSMIRLCFFRTMLKEMYDLMVDNKDIACMKTFEVASHTFGTANILNHLTVFDRLFAEYQNDLIRNNSEKL